MQSHDRFLLIIPLCAAAIALSSLAWHSSPPDVAGHRHMRLRYLRDPQLESASEGAWDADATYTDTGWPGADWRGIDRGTLRAARDLRHEAATQTKATAPESPQGEQRGNPTRADSSTVEKRCADSSQLQDAYSTDGPKFGAFASSSGDGEAQRREEKDLACDGGNCGDEPPVQEQEGLCEGEEEEEEDEDEENDSETAVEVERRVGMCAAAATEQVQCVLSSGGGAQGECGTNKLAACLARLEIARAGPNASTVIAHTKYGKMVLPLVDSFEGLALLFYGEWMEWGLNVIQHLVAQGAIGATVLDVNPGTGGVTLALARMVGTSGRVLVSEPRQFMMQSLAASAQLAGLNLEFLPCLWSRVGKRDMLQVCFCQQI